MAFDSVLFVKKVLVQTPYLMALSNKSKLAKFYFVDVFIIV